MSLNSLLFPPWESTRYATDEIKMVITRSLMRFRSSLNLLAFGRLRKERHFKVWYSCLKNGSPKMRRQMATH